jgi:transcriptional regulator with XRE-family HTH domain
MEFLDSFYRQVGKIIRTERELAELTQDELAVQVGLTRTSITNIEKGRQRIQLHTLYAIADELNISAFDLLPSSAAVDLSTVERLLPKGLLPEEQEWVKSVLSVEGGIAGSGGRKEGTLKQGITPSDLLREAQVKGPPVPVEQIARLNGVRIRSMPFRGEIAGLAFRSQKDAIVGVNSMHPKAKRRFTIAHELGHLALHRADEIHLDRHTTAYRIDKRSDRGSVAENEANDFATELILPRRMLQNDLKETLADYDDPGLVAYLASRYEVTSGIMAARLASLVAHDRR